MVDDKDDIGGLQTRSEKVVKAILSSDEPKEKESKEKKSKEK
ncbi:hypothetical protein [Methanosarcina mazei]|nr:hypothetical protein [Methanosarcina mazei]